MRLIHTADWQIGKPFSRFGDKAERLQSARLDAIETLGRLAIENDARAVLVAGDIYDSDSPTATTLRQPIERMRGFPAVRWLLLPGNHDCYRPGGVWERAMALGLPDNIHVLRAPEPFAIGDGTFVLPAPLTSRAEPRDLTAQMAQAQTPEGAIRIGLAHGSIASFDSEGEASNPIDSDRAEKAGLAYLALGDWHRTQRINPRTWYAGTPEPDRHESQTIGQALLVAIDGPSAVPRVEIKATGSYRWQSTRLEIGEANQLSEAEARLRREAEPLSRTVLKLAVTGLVSLGLRQTIEQWSEQLEASLCHLDCDLSGLRIRPEQAELETIDFDGVLHQVAERLVARAGDPSLTQDERRLAEEALVRLYIEVQATRETAA